MKPLFIALEALDGVGKTTLATALATRLGGRSMNTPGEGLRAVSGQVLDGLGPNQMARCLFYAASVVARGEEARAWVDQGQSVIMDRYWLSTVSYARARGVRDALSQLETRVPAPDITVLLSLDEGERQRRMIERGHTAADRETLDARFRDVVLAEMRSAERRPALRPTRVLDLTGLDPDQCVDAAVRVISAASGQT